MKLTTQKDYDLWIDFAKYSLTGLRMVDSESSASYIASCAFDDATAMMEALQSSLGTKPGKKIK